MIFTRTHQVVCIHRLTNDTNLGHRLASLSTHHITKIQKVSGQMGNTKVFTNAVSRPQDQQILLVAHKYSKESYTAMLANFHVYCIFKLQDFISHDHNAYHTQSPT